jgi:hypothetical protein
LLPFQQLSNSLGHILLQSLKAISTAACTLCRLIFHGRQKKPPNTVPSKNISIYEQYMDYGIAKPMPRIVCAAALNTATGVLMAQVNHYRWVIQDNNPYQPFFVTCNGGRFAHTYNKKRALQMNANQIYLAPGMPSSSWLPADLCTFGLLSALLPVWSGSHNAHPPTSRWFQH